MTNSNHDQLNSSFLAIVESDEKFPVDFDEASEWLGYSRTRNALRVLSGNFIEGVDFIVNKEVINTPLTTEQIDNHAGFSDSVILNKTANSHRRINRYLLTIDCFEELGMLTRTSKGREIRQFFLQVKKAYIQSLKDAVNQVSQSPVVGILTSWGESREWTKLAHSGFQKACIMNRFPAARVHDEITKRITGYTKKKALSELALVGGDPSIGLNHQPTPEQLDQIGWAKYHFSNLLAGSWEERVIKSVFKACPEEGDD